MRDQDQGPARAWEGTSTGVGSRGHWPWASPILIASRESTRVLQPRVGCCSQGSGAAAKGRVLLPTGPCPLAACPPASCDAMARLPIGPIRPWFLPS